MKPLDADRSVYHDLLELLAKRIDTLGRRFEPGAWPDLILYGSGKSAKSNVATPSSAQQIARRSAEGRVHIWS